MQTPPDGIDCAWYIELCADAGNQQVDLEAHGILHTDLSILLGFNTPLAGNR